MNSGNEYSLSEFRANLREAFNAAEKGEPVYIERYGVTYCLVAASDWDKGEDKYLGPDTILMHGDHGISKAAAEKIISDSQSEQKGGEQ